VGVAGNVLMLGTVHGARYLHGIRPVSVCLQIINTCNISGMDEATLFKFGGGTLARRGSNASL